MYKCLVTSVFLFGLSFSAFAAEARSFIHPDCRGSVTPVSAIQGAGRFSPLENQQLTTRGIVTQLNKDGFWIQSDNTEQDEDLQTSEGLFIRSSPAEVYPGLFISVSGEVAEKHQQTQLVAIQAIHTCGIKPLPAAVKVHLPLMPRKRWESLEGMRVSLARHNQRKPVAVISGFNGRGKGYVRFNEVVVSSQLHFQPSQSTRPLSHQALQHHRLYLQDQLLVSFTNKHIESFRPLHIGSAFKELSGVVHGIAKRDKQGKWWPRVIVDTAERFPAFEKTSQPSVALAMTGTDYSADENLIIASLNMNNYFNGSGKINAQGVGDLSRSRGARTAAEFHRQTQKLVAALVPVNADILILNEVENDGDGKDSAIAYFVQQLNLTQKYRYDWVKSGKTGSDKIRNVLLYRPERVAAEGEVHVMNARTSVRDNKGKPLFDDYGNRPVLIQAFRRNDKTLLIAALHLKSKGSSCKESKQQRNGGGACNGKRRRAAAAIAEALQNHTPRADFQLIAGDFNSYGQEDPMQVFYRQGWRNAASFSADDKNWPHFSYRFRGRLGALDHILLNKALVGRVQGFKSWHINSLVSDKFSYRLQSSEHSVSLPVKGKLADYLRSSDHDPQILTLRM